MRRNLALSFFLCFVATTGVAQSRLNGRWETDRPTGEMPITDAQRKQSAQLEVTIEGAKASGTLTLGGLGGTFYTFNDGKVTDNKVQLRTDAGPTGPTWTIEMVDDTTVMLYHGGLPLVGNNVLDLLSAMGIPNRPASPIPAAVVTSPTATPSTTFAQGGAIASIGGIIQDQSMARIPGVTVTATNVDTGVKLTTLSNDAASYGFPSVIPGTYTLTASLPGFQTMTVSNLRIGDTKLVQDFTLELKTARASANPTAATCSRSGIVWCAILHRTK